MDKYLQVGDGELTVRDSNKIIDRLVKENPKMTIAEYLDKQFKIKVVLV